MLSWQQDRAGSVSIRPEETSRKRAAMANGASKSLQSVTMRGGAEPFHMVAGAKLTAFIGCSVWSLHTGINAEGELQLAVQHGIWLACACQVRQPALVIVPGSRADRSARRVLKPDMAWRS